MSFWILLRVFQILLERRLYIVVVERLSKAAHLMVLSHPYTASVMAQAYLDNILNYMDLRLSQVIEML